MSDTIIRPFEARDANGLSALYVRSVERLGPRHYTPQQVEAWASRRPSPERLQAMSADGRVMLVAVGASAELLAFGDLEADGHIHFLYCAPEAAGKGVASALYDALERVAHEHGLPRLFAEASEAACRFFRKKGFVIGDRREFAIGGVPIHNYVVEKRLDLADRSSA